MKYTISTLFLLVSLLFYSQYRSVKFNIAIETQYEIDHAELEFAKETARFNICQARNFLYKKMKYKSWTNCSSNVDNHDDEFGKHFNDLDPSYNSIGEANAKAQVMRNDIKLIISAMLGLPRPTYKELPGPYGQTLLWCDYKNEKLEVFRSYRYGYWTEKRMIVISEAYEVKNCVPLTWEE